MRSVFRRLFSSDYRRALAAEAAGDHLSAARSYALCGEPLKVADMHLARARGEKTLDGRIRALRTALDFAPPRDGRHAFIARMLADSITVKAQPLDACSREGRALRLEAAELLERGEAWAEAGERYHELGEVDRAARAFGRAGLLERVEQVLEQRERAEQSDRVARDSYADYSIALQEGARARALAALERCVAHMRDSGPYRELLTQLRGQMLGKRARLTWQGLSVQFVGRPPTVIGRDPASDLELRGPAVSREHARISFAEQPRCFFLEDAGSRNGTLIGGLPLARAFALTRPTLFQLGDEGPTLRASPVSAPTSALSLEIVEGCDRGSRFVVVADAVDLRAIIPAAPALQLSFGERAPEIRAIDAAAYLLNGNRVGPLVELISGDVITVGGDDLVVS